MKSNSGVDTPTSTEVREAFDYEDGKLYWKRTGRLAGTVHKSGYVTVNLNKRLVRLHKLIYCYHHDVWPDVIDHIDQDKTNNRIENLRLATKSLNEANTGPRVTNKIGYKGVCKMSNHWKFRATIKGLHLGLFATAEEAARAYDKKAVELYGDFAFTNFKEAI